MPAMTDSPGNQTNSPAPVRIRSALLAICIVIASWTFYANAAILVTDPADYRFFPPFEPDNNGLMTRHLGAEYLNIAKALRGGRGFADPFRAETGPTAWMPPALPFIQAGLLWLAGDDVDILMYCVIVAQSVSLAVSGWLLLAASARAFRTHRPWTTAAIFVIFLAAQFRLAFQITHDSWLQLLALDTLLLGYALLSDAPRWWGLIWWGVAGGVTALAGPVLGLVWATLTVLRWPTLSRWRHWLVAGLFALICVSPWIVRNALVFGRFIPLKSNLFYELYQSQCESADGLVRESTFRNHPYGNRQERYQYEDDGESVYLDGKRAQFVSAFRAKPGDFAVRVWNRFAAAVVLYVPMDDPASPRPFSFWRTLPQLCQPLPLLAAVVLLISPRRLHRYEAAALYIFVIWLLPYVIVSYYDRYGFPLLPVRVFLCAAAIDRFPRKIRTL
jgi:hypothetical protein